MARFLLLVTALGLVGVLGFVIDVHSRTEVNYPEYPTTPQAVYALGRVEGLTPEIDLRAQVIGRVDQLLVEEGQRVETGTVLLRFDDEQLRCEVARAEAELDLAQAQLENLLAGARPQQRSEAAAKHRAKLAELEQAELTWKRFSGLLDASAVSRQEADKHRTAVAALTAEAEAAKAQWELIQAPPREDEVHMQKARIQAAKAHLGLARAQLDRTSLRAPVGGQVLKINVHLGELTGPNSGEPAVVLADTKSFRVRAFVEELDAPRIRVGMTATVTADGLPGGEFSGRVVRLSPYMSRKVLWSDHPAERYDTKTREVWIDLAEGQGMIVGLRVDVMIDAAERSR